MITYFLYSNSYLDWYAQAILFAVCSSQGQRE